MNEQIELAIARMRQEIWFTRRNLTWVLHGPVQSALVSATIRLESGAVVDSATGVDADADANAATDADDADDEEDDDDDPDGVDIDAGACAAAAADTELTRPGLPLRWRRCSCGSFERAAMGTGPVCALRMNDSTRIDGGYLRWRRRWRRWRRAGGA